MQVQVPLVGDLEQAQQVGGIVLEDVGIDVQSSAHLMEARPGQRLALHGAPRQEAADALRDNAVQTTLRVILPALMPALVTGFSLALARGVGEYGSVIFIAGNMPYISEIAPLLIVIKLQEYDYAGAAAVGVIMLAISLLILLFLNIVQRFFANIGSAK